MFICLFHNYFLIFYLISFQIYNKYIYIFIEKKKNYKIMQIKIKIILKIYKNFFFNPSLIKNIAL